MKRYKKETQVKATLKVLLSLKGTVRLARGLKSLPNPIKALLDSTLSALTEDYKEFFRK